MPENIERNPLFLPRQLRMSCYLTLGAAIAAFENEDAYSVDPGGSNAVRGILFWMSRVRSHLAPGLRKVPEELALRVGAGFCPIITRPRPSSFHLALFHY